MRRCLSLLAPLVALLALHLACTPKRYATFVNATSGEVCVSLVDEGDGKVFRKFVVSRGESVRSEIILSRGNFRLQSGRVIEKQVPLLDPDGAYRSRWRSSIDFLITDTDVYPIPNEYRDNWRAHYQEIVASTNMIITPTQR
jgi:hypothetical protein